MPSSNPTPYKKCIGCIALLEEELYTKKIAGCAYAQIGIKYLKKCPCFECLVKMVCGIACKTFVDFVNNHSNKFTDIIVGEKR